MSRYFFYADPSIPQEYEKTVPQVFPTSAPGNFTWLPECGHYVMTTFYPYQWDLNYRNPGADMNLSTGELDRKLIADAAIFHYGSLSMTDEPCRSATRKGALRVMPERSEIEALL